MVKILLLVATLCLIACDAASYNPAPNNNTPDVPNERPDSGSAAPFDAALTDPSPSPVTPETHTDGIMNAGETDIDCGGTAPQCGLDQRCLKHSDCLSEACSYTGKCVDLHSCTSHFGGDTCGQGEVGEGVVSHESCCLSLPVLGYVDPTHLGKTTYLDKYEITAGRMRAFVDGITRQMAGKPDVKGWVEANLPTVWNPFWNSFLPSDYDGNVLTIGRLLLGDPRHDGQTPQVAGPGVIIPPSVDQQVSVGLNHQFGGQVFADLHGNNCGVFAGAYGFPTYYYSADVQKKNGEVPRGNAFNANGKEIQAQDFLDVKSMNCVTNAMLVAFCAWDGGQLATSEVMDYVMNSPTRSQDVSGCGSQYDNHGELLGNVFTNTVQSGGRCPDVTTINATFDAGDVLPVPGSALNKHNYHYPDLGASDSDKTWEISAPGRVPADAIRVDPTSGTWMDLAGNLNESTLETQNGAATGRFALKGRGIGYGSARSDLNVTLMPGETVLRVQRPEAKSALVGGRCMRFK